jgi:lysophospholipase L1-like esterase
VNAPLFYAVTAAWAAAWLALVWFRQHIRFAEPILIAATLGLLFWLSAGFDWGVFDERPFAVPPPDQTWNIADHTDLLGNQATRDRWVFHHRPVTRDKRGAFRVVTLGTSSTFGSGLLARDLPYPRVLESRLRQLADAPVQVVNAGLTGYHSFQLMLLDTQVLTHLAPDLTIFYYGANEGSGNEVKRYYAAAAAIKQAANCQTPDCLRWAIAHGTSAPLALRVGVWLERFGGYRFLRNTIMRQRQLFPAGIEPATQDTELPPHSAEILALIAEAARAKKTPLVLVPELAAAGGPVNPDYAALMRDAATDGVHFLDLSADFGVHPELFLDQIHPTAAGHRVLGKLLVERLVAAGLIRKKK